MRRFTANLSLLFTEYPWTERFLAAKQAGFSAVEIQFPYHLPPELLKQLLEQAELKLVLFNVAADDLLQGGEGLAAVPEKHNMFIDALSQAVNYAEVLKPEIINILPGCCQDTLRLPEYLQCFKSNLALAAKTFAALGINTVFEAINTQDMPGFIIHNGQQMLDICQELALANLGLQYDIYHLHTMGENCSEFILQHADKIFHIQFADSPGRGQPGTGNIDFCQLFSSIDQSGYHGWLGAEYRPSTPTINSLGWLKTLQ